MKHRSIAWIVAGFIGALILASSAAAHAADDRLALKGYDPVAYFTEKRPMVGDPQYQYEWDGAIYRFASAKHLELFKATPDRYLPQYNNWCAASVAKGVKVYGNPEWWLVVDGRLYLFGKPIGPGLMKARSGGHEEQGRRELAESLKLPTRRCRTTCAARATQ